MTLVEECLFLLASEQLEVTGVKSERMMTFEFLTIFQHNSLRIGVAVLTLSPASQILVPAILVPFGRSLFDSSGVFISIRGVWVLSDNFLLQIGHCLEVCVIGFVHGSLDCGSMRVFQLGVSHLTQ